MKKDALPTSISEASAAPNVTIIYDDLQTGLRAKDFHEMLLAELGCTPADPACWRTELLDFATIATQALSDAAQSEFVFLSLRGDRALPSPLRQWLESWLALETSRQSSLIVLFDPVRSVVNEALGARHYIRRVTSEAGVAFFAHCSVGATIPAKYTPLPSFTSSAGPLQPVETGHCHIVALYPATAAA